VFRMLSLLALVSVLMLPSAEDLSAQQGCWYCSNFTEPEWGLIHQDYEEPEGSFTFAQAGGEFHFYPSFGEGSCCEAHSCPQYPGDLCWKVIAEDLSALESAVQDHDPIAAARLVLSNPAFLASYDPGVEIVEGTDCSGEIAFRFELPRGINQIIGYF